MFFHGTDLRVHGSTLALYIFVMVLSPCREFTPHFIYRFSKVGSALSPQFIYRFSKVGFASSPQFRYKFGKIGSPLSSIIFNRSPDFSPYLASVVRGTGLRLSEAVQIILILLKNLRTNLLPWLDGYKADSKRGASRIGRKRPRKLILTPHRRAQILLTSRW